MKLCIIIISSGSMFLYHSCCMLVSFILLRIREFTRFLRDLTHSVGCQSLLVELIYLMLMKYAYRHFPKMFHEVTPNDPTMIGLTFAFVFLF